MIQENQNGYILAFGLLLGFILGFAFDIYEINVFGEVGLGLVFGPMIGILVTAIFVSFRGSRLLHSASKSE